MYKHNANSKDIELSKANLLCNIEYKLESMNRSGYMQ